MADWPGNWAWAGARRGYGTRTAGWTATLGQGGVLAGDLGWVPPGVDPAQANVARVYDYWLGGSHNFLADQDLGRAMAAVVPNVRAIARANRAFLAGPCGS